MIFFNIVLATITNGYDNMKEKIDKKGYEDKNVCFICGKTKNDCIGDNEDFDEHIENHDKWKKALAFFQEYATIQPQRMTA